MKTVGSFYEIELNYFFNNKHFDFLAIHQSKLDNYNFLELKVN